MSVTYAASRRSSQRAAPRNRSGPVAVVHNGCVLCIVARLRIERGLGP